MNDADFQHLMQQARHASAKVDLSAREYGFETRLSARLADLRHQHPGTIQLLWRAVAGCAAFVGLLAVWFILAQSPQAAEDDLTAFWDSGQASYDSEILD
jgi:hypothetical protein